MSTILYKLSPKFIPIGVRVIKYKRKARNKKLQKTEAQSHIFIIEFLFI